MGKLWVKADKLHVGSWVNALKTLDNNWFMTFNGYEFDKKTTYNQLEEYYYRINKSVKWF